MLMRCAPLLLAAVLAMPARSADSVPEQAAAAEANQPDQAGLLEFRPGGDRSAYREHAPLALFSLGSLAVGGVFYAIHASLDYPGSGQVSGDGSRVEMAVGAAGISALAAGAAYLYYALRGEKHEDARSGGASGGSAALSAAGLAGGLTPGGGVAASLTVPLSALVD